MEYESELEHQLSTADEELAIEKEQSQKLQNDYKKVLVRFMSERLKNQNHAL